MTAETSATWRMALSVSVATGAYGVSFGALAVAAGLDVWQTMVLSLLMYTGGSQFAFVGALAGGGLPAGLPILAAVVVGGGAALLQRRRTARRDQSSRDEGVR